MPRYSETLMDHFQSPRNWGTMQDADVVGVAGVPGQGRYLVLYLKIEQSRVRETLFQCHGCGPTIAAGSLLTEMIAGMTLEECRAITMEQVIDGLDGLPPDKRHTTGFAVNALNQALAEYTSPEV